jgi:hypothetical protein
MMRPLRLSLRVIAVVQAFFGLLFLAAPAAAPDLLGLADRQPAWVDWLFAMMAARFLGYAVGMWLAARDPRRHVAWIDTMIGIQVLDWLATLAFLASGELALRNVTSAAFLPPLFIAALVWWHPRRARRQLRLAEPANAPAAG